MHGQQNIISIPGFSKRCLTFKFPHDNPVHIFLFPPIRAIWPTNLSFFLHDDATNIRCFPLKDCVCIYRPVTNTPN